jgi:hypothetical protein
LEDSRKQEENMNHPEMRNTVFGAVLAELLEARGLPVTPFAVGKIAEQSGLDGWKVLGRMASADADDPGHLDGLAHKLALSTSEMVELAHAYVYERRADEMRAGQQRA